MKIRTDFVTNSSSSSFIISKRFLDNDQLEAIRNHYCLAKKLNLEIERFDQWNIDEDSEFITGYTHMDNFDMNEFLQKIEVDSRCVHWGEFSFNLSKPNRQYHRKRDSGYNDYEDDEPTWRDLL